MEVRPVNLMIDDDSYDELHDLLHDLKERHHLDRDDLVTLMVKKSFAHQYERDNEAFVRGFIVGHELWEREHETQA